MSDTIEIRIPGRPPTPNSRRHWRVTHRDNGLWHNIAWTMSRFAASKLDKPIDRATVAVEFVVPDKRRRDVDNLVASQKPLLDGIVAAGVLLDDSSDVLVSVTYSVTYVKGESATVYRITPVVVEAAA